MIKLYHENPIFIVFLKAFAHGGVNAVAPSGARRGLGAGCSGAW